MAHSKISRRLVTHDVEMLSEHFTMEYGQAATINGFENVAGSVYQV